MANLYKLGTSRSALQGGSSTGAIRDIRPRGVRRDGILPDGELGGNDWLDIRHWRFSDSRISDLDGWSGAGRGRLFRRTRGCPSSRRILHVFPGIRLPPIRLWPTWLAPIAAPAVRKPVTIYFRATGRRRKLRGKGPRGMRRLGGIGGWFIFLR